MDNHDITVIQVNKNLELHLGYVGGTTTGFDEADPIYTADKPFIALKSEIPTKTSDLQNDSGFISNIPQNLVTEQELDNKGYLTSFTQSDPVYSKDKPNLALKSELFSKSYNDLTDKPSIPSIDGLASVKYVDDKVANIEIPTKTSDLTNDSGFITANDIPEVQITETDPIYSKDKPNIALKSELFSKDYNDLSNKPDLYTPKSDGDGSKFLADDGTYKSVQGGGSSSDVDLSDYSSTAYSLTWQRGKNNRQQILTTSADSKGVSLGNQLGWTQINGQPIIDGTYWNDSTAYVSDLQLRNINDIVFNGSYCNQANGLVRLNYAGALNTEVNLTDYTIQYLSDYQSITLQSNSFICHNNPEEQQAYLYQLELNIPQNCRNSYILFKTHYDSFVYNITIPSNYYLVNKPFDFQPNAVYLIAVDYTNMPIIIWTELQIGG